MLALGELILFFASAAGCARFCSVQRCSRGAQVYGTLPDAAFCYASQPTKLYTSRQDVMRHTAHAFGSVSFFYNSRSRASVVRSTARARTPPVKCRSIQVKPLVSRHRAGRRVCTLRRSVGRMVETATQDDLSGLAGTPVACRRDICVCLLKTGFDRSVGGAVWALTGDPCPREKPPQRLLDYFQRAVHRCGCGEAKPRRIQSPAAPAASTVAALHARAATLAARVLLPRETRARRPWARKKKKMTSPRPST